MIYVLDSGAILNSFSFYFDQDLKYATTPEIISEMKDLRSRMLVEDALHRSLLKITEPNEKTIEEVKTDSEKILHKKLSQADISIIALAKDLSEKEKIIVITDDYAVQNMLSILKIPYEGVLMPGIRETISFYKECPNCKKKFPQETTAKKCDVCATPIKSKKKKLA